jgi:hypothetical protein
MSMEAAALQLVTLIFRTRVKAGREETLRGCASSYSLLWGLR